MLRCCHMQMTVRFNGPLWRRWSVYVCRLHCYSPSFLQTLPPLPLPGGSLTWSPLSPPSTLSHTGSVTLRCFLAGSPNVLQFSFFLSIPLSLSLYPLPSLFCSSEKQWFMNCNIYHKTVLLHACSYMIHPQVLLGPHHRRMPICLGKEKVKLWAQKTQCDPRNGVSKVQYVHFYPALWIWLWWKKSNNDKTIALG